MSNIFNFNSIITPFDRYKDNLKNIKFFKKVLDAYQYNYTEFKKCREQIMDNNKVWNFYNVRMDFSRRLVKNSDGYFEIPIFIKLEIKDIEWILSHEITDIIRIMVENKFKILENGKMVKET
jgi:hypothetical protein